MFQNVLECMQNVPEYMQNVPESMQNVPECMQNVPGCSRMFLNACRSMNLHVLEYSGTFCMHSRTFWNVLEHSAYLHACIFSILAILAKVIKVQICI